MSNPVNRDNRADGGVSDRNNDHRNRSENLTPSQLVKSLKNGDPSALDSIIELKSAQLKSFLFRMLNSREDAEEIAQDVFIFIWENKDYISENRSFDGLLFSVSYRRAINRIKERKRFLNLLTEEYNRPVDYADSPDNIVELNEAQEKIDRVIAEMPAVMRRIYTMKFHEGFSNERIASEMSITQSTVRVQILNAEKRIREAVVSARSVP